MSLKDKGCVLWFTGLSGAGKSTLAEALKHNLAKTRVPVIVLDGDVLRTGLCKDLSYTIEDRTENLRRTAEVAKLFSDQGMICICSFISPLRNAREAAREIVEPDHFHEVYISTPLATCESRDVKGLYNRARSGELDNFTGISSPFEVPEDPALSIDTSSLTIEEGVEQLVGLLEKVCPYLALAATDS